MLNLPRQVIYYIILVAPARHCDPLRRRRPILRCGGGWDMANKPDELLPSASDIMKKLALAEAEEASKQARQFADAEAEKQALLDRFKQPSGLSDEEVSGGLLRCPVLSFSS